MQRQLQDAIKSKYGVSKRTSGQVIKALTEVEKQRQRTKVGIPSRPGREREQQSSSSPLDGQVSTIAHDWQSSSSNAAQDEQVPDIESIVGGLLGGGSGGGLLGLILTIIKSLFGRGGSSQSQSNVTNILSDLTGGATQPGQAPDLASILTGLLAGGGSTTGSGSQTSDIEGLVMSLLSGQTSSQGGRTSRKSR